MNLFGRLSDMRKKGFFIIIEFFIRGKPSEQPFGSLFINFSIIFKQMFGNCLNKEIFPCRRIVRAGS